MTAVLGARFCRLRKKDSEDYIEAYPAVGVGSE